jgi:2-polyprenyl-6-methoxyphenol hydroxylase-like FAD-dependent oxidoreductase
MRILVVGAGIGGLAVAIGLRRARHEVVVLEQAATIEAVGAGITLFANAMQALARLDVADSVAARGAAAARSAILTRGGDELAVVPDDVLRGAVAVHRADLQAALVEALGDVQLGVEVVGVAPFEGGAVVQTALRPRRTRRRADRRRRTRLGRARHSRGDAATLRRIHRLAGRLHRRARAGKADRVLGAG